MRWPFGRRPPTPPPLPSPLTVAEQISRLAELGIRLRPGLTVAELEREIAWAHVAADGLGHDRPFPPDPARRCLYWWLLTQDAVEGARQVQYPLRSEYATLLTAERFLARVQEQTDLPVEMLAWHPTWQSTGADLVTIGGHEVILLHDSTLDSRREFFAALLDAPSVFVTSDRWMYSAGSVVPVPAEHREELQRLVDETVAVAFLGTGQEPPEHLLTAGLPAQPTMIATTDRQRATVARRRHYLETTGAPPLTLEHKLMLLERIGIPPVPGADLHQVDVDGFYAQSEDGAPLLRYVHWQDLESFGSFADWTPLVHRLSEVTGTPVTGVSTGDGIVRLTVAGTTHEIPAEDLSHERYTTLDLEALDRIAGLLTPEGRELISTGDLLLYPRAGTWQANPEVRRI